MKNHSISTYRRRQAQHLAHPQLFAEVIESVTTTDYKFEDPDGSWGSCSSRPPGRGWRVIDSRRERHTKWTRRTPVLWPVRPPSGGRRRG